jgi:hypothetical protein
VITSGLWHRFFKSSSPEANDSTESSGLSDKKCRRVSAYHASSSTINTLNFFISTVCAIYSLGTAFLSSCCSKLLFSSNYPGKDGALGVSVRVILSRVYLSFILTHISHYKMRVTRRVGKCLVLVNGRENP